MYEYLKIFTLLLVMSVTFGAVTREKLPHVQGGRKECFVELLNKTIPVGAVETPIGNCQSITCYQDEILYFTCGTVAADPPCYVTDEDLSLPYPNCCARVRCD